MNTYKIFIIDDKDNSVIDAFPHYLPFGKVTKCLAGVLNIMSAFYEVYDEDFSYGVFTEKGRIANFYNVGEYKTALDGYGIGRFINGTREAEYYRLNPVSNGRNNKKRA